MSMNAFGEALGPSQNNASAGLSARKAIRRQLRELYKCEIMLVLKHDPETNTVAVVSKTNPFAAPIYGVPVAPIGRCFVEFKTIEEDGVDEADAGIVFYPDADSSLAYVDHSRLTPPSGTAITHSGQGPFFIGPLTLLSDAPFDEGDDVGLYWKKNGTLQIRAESVEILGPGQGSGSLAKVARQGDSGDGTGGSIAGGTSRLKVTD